MKFWKSLKKNCNAYNLFLILVIVVVLFVILRYSQSKGLFRDNMSSNESMKMEQPTVNTPDIMAADSQMQGSGMNVGATDLTTTGTNNSSCNNNPVMNPDDLLPSDSNSEWSRLNPAGNDLKNMNFLKAGHHHGINTVGQSLRNANLQLRSEPPNPQLETGPWNNTTMAATDSLRRPFEIGNGTEM